MEVSLKEGFFDLPGVWGRTGGGIAEKRNNNHIKQLGMCLLQFADGTFASGVLLQ